MASKTYNGSCACGATTWQVDLPKDKQNTILCHCKTCQKLSGGAFTLNQVVPKSALRFKNGESALKSFDYTGISGNPVHCYYCPTCTTHVYHHQTVAGPDLIVVRTGLLDDADDILPAAEIFGKDRLKWEKEVATTFEVLPPE